LFRGAKVQLFSILQTVLRKIFFLCSFFAGFEPNKQTKNVLLQIKAIEYGRWNW
jgi:hypothetical protein